MSQGTGSDRVSLDERFSGCLIGQCLGDAIGFPVEGYVADVCRQYVSGVLRTGRAGEVGRPPFAFGQYTDDSQLARELLLSYRERRGFDPAAFAARLAAAFSRGGIVGQGRATASAARRLAGGVPWEEAGEAPPSAGNGSAMRAGPVGLLFHDDPEGMVRAAVDQGRVTHRDRRCCGGAVAVAGAVALAMRDEPLDSALFIDVLKVWVEPVDSSTAEALSSLGEWIDMAPGDVASRVGALGSPEKDRSGWKGISPFVTGSVMWSIYSFLRSPDDYWETVCMAISGGGDTDTTAAMAGAISGARLGLEGIPPLLARKLNDRGEWGYDRLVELAVDCCRIRNGPGGG